jgi:hypothetical protein
MKELTPHPQADILRAIADGKTVQMRSRLRPTTWHDEPTPFEYLSDELFEWRIKPETITINGHEVPAPVREPLENGQVYWQVSLGNDDMCFQYAWRGDYSGDMLLLKRGLLKRGLIHLTREAAIAHAEALLSFTRIDDK